MNKFVLIRFFQKIIYISFVYMSFKASEMLHVVIFYVVFKYYFIAYLAEKNIFLSFHFYHIIQCFFMRDIHHDIHENRMAVFNADKA